MDFCGFFLFEKQIKKRVKVACFLRHDQCFSWFCEKIIKNSDKILSIILIFFFWHEMLKTIIIIFIIYVFKIIQFINYLVTKLFLKKIYIYIILYN
jgi:hypothetical protein